MQSLYRRAVAARLQILIGLLIAIIGILLVPLFRAPLAPPEQTPTPSATATVVQQVAAATPQVEQTPASTATMALTVTLTLSASPTSIPTLADTSTSAETPTLAPTSTATVTETPTSTSTPTPTATLTPTATPTSILTPSPTVTLTRTPMPTVTPTKLVPWTPIASITATLSVTQTPIVTAAVGGATTCTEASYTIQSGDTLTSIAFRFGVSLSTIRAANPDLNGDTLQIGEILLIPCPEAGSSTLPASVKLTVMPQLLGHSTGGWPIEVFQFGSGPVRLVFVGGIHGGYEWNTILLAYAAIDYFSTHPESVPSTLTLYIIPTANPDGLALLTGQSERFTQAQITTDPIPGRFNANRVDLNRNWDCRWQAQGVWGNRPVSAGQAPFSEIETQVLRTFLTNPPADGVVFWHSAQPGVFAGGCDSRLAAGDELASLYATASGYPFLASFDSYTVTGDAADWLAQQGIPAIEVELTNHSDFEWEKNLRAMLALIQHVAKLDNTNK